MKAGRKPKVNYELLRKLIEEDNLNYRQVGRIVGCSPTWVRLICMQRGWKPLYIRRKEITERYLTKENK